MISFVKFLIKYLEEPVFSYNTSPPASSINSSSVPSVTRRIPCSTAYRSTLINLLRFTYKVQSVSSPGIPADIYSVSCDKINWSSWASLSSRNINNMHRYTYSSLDENCRIPIKASGTTGIFSILISNELSII